MRLAIVVGMDYVFFLTEEGEANLCGGPVARGIGQLGTGHEWLELVSRYGA